MRILRGVIAGPVLLGTLILGVAALPALAFQPDGHAVPDAPGVDHGTGAAADHDAEHPQGVPLDFQADLALWSLVVFLLFLWILKKMAWKPLISALDSRESQIRQDIAAAEAARRKSEQMLVEHEKKLAQVQDEVKEIIAEARRDAEHTKQDIINTAQAEAEATQRRAITEIQRARDQALKELFDQEAARVANATEHVLGRALTDADQERFIEEALAQIGRN